ncbi:MAG: hypothetical protein M0006_13075 [Magnetospirillum sp.]|nr:hypothetical protein [Magnetospirillum sp.]
MSPTEFDRLIRSGVPPVAMPSGRVERLLDPVLAGIDAPPRRPWWDRAGPADPWGQFVSAPLFPMDS